MVNKKKKKRIKDRQGKKKKWKKSQARKKVEGTLKS